MRMLYSMDFPWLSSVMFISLQDVFLVCFSIASSASFDNVKLKVCTAARHMRTAGTHIRRLNRAANLSLPNRHMTSKQHRIDINAT